MPTKNEIFISVKRLKNQSFKKCVNILKKELIESYHNKEGILWLYLSENK